MGVERSIKELERRIAEKDLFPKAEPSKTPATPELEAMRARRDALRAELEDLQEAARPRLSPEQMALKHLKSRLTRSIADYQDRLANGDFSPRKKPARDISMDEEAMSLKAENEQMKALFDAENAREQFKRSSVAKKVIAGTKEALNFPRNALSSWDLSAVLRQGGFIAFSNPARAAKSIVPMLKAVFSEKAAGKIEQQILHRKNALNGLYKQSKLYIAPLESFKLSLQEEMLMSRLNTGKFAKFTGIRASNRAFITFLNKLRADSFDAMVWSLSRDRSLSPNELKAIANYINVATGRGNMYKAAAAAETLATVFFSPRLMVSRFQLLFGQPLYEGSARTRAAITKEYAKALTGLGVVYGLGALAGAEIETDSRSSDFGKLKFGNTRVDPLTGLAQVSVLFSRIKHGEKKTASGRIVPIRGKLRYGQENTYDVIGRFARSKFSPVLGTSIDVATGSNVVGEEVTAKDALANLVVPLSYRDVIKIMEEQGVPAGTALEVLNMLGMGVQNYD